MPQMFFSAAISSSILFAVFTLFFCSLLMTLDGLLPHRDEVIVRDITTFCRS